MKKTILTTIFGLATIYSLANAQTTSYSEIVGYQSISVPAGLSTASFPLLNPDLVKTSATSLSGSSLTLSGQSNVGALLSAAEPYYLEVYSGNLKGDRFDVDTAATITAGNSSVVLNNSSANNTYAVGSIASQLNGATVALRKHITLDQVQAMSSTPLVGNNSSLVADQIQFYDSSSQGYVTYFLRGDGITWRKAGTVDSGNKVPIPPGVGLFILKQGAPATFVSTGTVRNNDFATPLRSGLQLSASGFPIDVSPAALGGSATNGWTGNNSSAAADQIQVFNSSVSGYETYFLRGDGTTWRKAGTTDAVTSSNIVTSSQAFFVLRQNADNNYILSNPIGQ